MNKNSEDSKSKDKRLEEKDKLEAEAQRSYAVAEMKKAHKLIEETEKSRKRPTLQSICHRIDAYRPIVASIAFMFGNKPFAETKIRADNAKEILHYIVQTYDSIRYDLQKNMDIKDEDLEKLLPRVEVNMKDGDSVATSLSCMDLQVGDMRRYCERMLQ